MIHNVKSLINCTFNGKIDFFFMRYFFIVIIFWNLIFVFILHRSSSTAPMHPLLDFKTKSQSKLLKKDYRNT